MEPRVWSRAAAALAIVLVILVARKARATYSIAATDAKTRQVGGAVTSCVGMLDVGVVYGGVPGKGVVHAQAQLDPMGRGKMKAMMMLTMDAAPADIVAAITASSFDGGAGSRQYGIVDLGGRAAGFTGDGAMAYKADKQGKLGAFTYSVQGNILTSGKVLDQAAAGFETGGGCDLADRLMLALEAGAKGGEGDSRCTVKMPSTPSDSAFIEVDGETGAPGSYLKLSVTNTRPGSPLVALRTKFDDWRKTHPCPAMPDGGAADAVPPADGGGSGDGAGGAGGGSGSGDGKQEGGRDGGAAGNSGATCDCRLGGDSRRGGGASLASLVGLALAMCGRRLSRARRREP